MLIDENQIATAFAHSRFFFEYQPIVTLETGRTPYVESLIRWNHASLGILTPDSFLSLIHGADLSEVFTEWSLHQALKDLPELRRQYSDDIAVTVNLSQRQLMDPEATATQIAQAISTADEDPGSVCIEIVEDLTNGDIRRSAAAIATLRAIGVRVFLDDFGTGASSLSALTEMDCDGLKIDKSFVQGIGSGRIARSIVQAILTIGKNADMVVIAEGVELASDLEELAAMGCDLAQGFLLGRPTSIEHGPDPIASAPAIPKPKPVSLDPGIVELNAIEAELERIDPRLDKRSFDQTQQRLEQLDLAARALGSAGDLVRCEIGRKMVVAAIYAGDLDTSLDWGAQTSEHAEKIGQWAYCVEFAAVAASTQSPRIAPSARIDALIKALEIRFTKQIDPKQHGIIDNDIGRAFAELGLLDHAHSWWKDSIGRDPADTTTGIALCCVNLTELELERLEGQLTLAHGLPRALGFALIEQILERLATIPYIADHEKAVAALRCRLRVAQGDLAGAAAALAESTGAGSGVLPNRLMLRAQVAFAEAAGDGGQFLASATALAEMFEGNPHMAHYDQQAQNFVAKALCVNNRHAEAVPIFERLLERTKLEGAHNLQTLFEWIRLNADLNLRFAELEELGSSASDRITPTPDSSH